ncbi:MAG: SDR family NAD(P)-dependent oxidoreductase [Candidatus Cryptobacteroides sp.]
MGQIQGQVMNPAINGSWFIVTGASGSIGREVVKGLAGRGIGIIMACRNLSKGEAVMKSVLADVPDARLRLEMLDLSSSESIHSFVKRIANDNISGIFNNAGAIFRDFGLTPEGRERTFAVNYYGPVELTEALLPMLKPGSSIVNMVSVTARISSLSDADFIPEKKRFGQLKTYGKAKLALLRYSRELAGRRPDLHVNVADPGVVNSNMISMGRWFDPLADVLFRPFCKSPAKGAVPAINAILYEGSLRYFSGTSSRPM